MGSPIHCGVTGLDMRCGVQEETKPVGEGIGQNSFQGMDMAGEQAPRNV